jgi:hypothetical protein
MFVQCSFGQEKLSNKQNAVLQTKGLDSVKSIFLFHVLGGRDNKLTGMTNITVCTLVLYLLYSAFLPQGDWKFRLVVCSLQF